MSDEKRDDAATIAALGDEVVRLTRVNESLDAVRRNLTESRDAAKAEAMRQAMLVMTEREIGDEIDRRLTARAEAAETARDEFEAAYVTFREANEDATASLADTEDALRVAEAEVASLRARLASVEALLPSQARTDDGGWISPAQLHAALTAPADELPPPPGTAELRAAIAAWDEVTP